MTRTLIVGMVANLSKSEAEHITEILAASGIDAVVISGVTALEVVDRATMP